MCLALYHAADLRAVGHALGVVARADATDEDHASWAPSPSEGRRISPPVGPEAESSRSNCSESITSGIAAVAVFAVAGQRGRRLLAGRCCRAGSRWPRRWPRPPRSPVGPRRRSGSRPAWHFLAQMPHLPLVSCRQAARSITGRAGHRLREGHVDGRPLCPCRSRTRWGSSSRGRRSSTGRSRCTCPCRRSGPSCGSVTVKLPT